MLEKINIHFNCKYIKDQIRFIIFANEKSYFKTVKMYRSLFLDQNQYVRWRDLGKCLLRENNDAVVNVSGRTNNPLEYYNQLRIALKQFNPSRFVGHCFSFFSVGENNVFRKTPSPTFALYYSYLLG